MKILAALIIPVALGWLLVSTPARAEQPQTVLMLDGDVCELHVDDAVKALKTVKGVTDVDLKIMPGHLVVSHDKTVTAETLIDAVKEIKGKKDGVEWTCDAMEMD